MKKYISFEHTITKQELENILFDYFQKKMSSEDKDFKEIRFMQSDATYRFESGNPEIDIVFLCDRVKLRKP